jgi:hypothetical protein
MPFYLKVSLSENGTADTNGEIEKVELRAHATELIYSDAGRLQGLAQEQWPDCTWRIEHALTRKYVVRGTQKSGKP